MSLSLPSASSLTPATFRSTAKLGRPAFAHEQVHVITVGEDEPLLHCAKQIVNELRAYQIRATGDFSSDPMKAKIANAEQAKVHKMLVIGGRDMDAGAVSVCLHGKGNVGAKPKAEVIADILAAIKERRS
jgi:threonyl-tRNA synthetase